MMVLPKGRQLNAETGWQRFGYFCRGVYRVCYIDTYHVIKDVVWWLYDHTIAALIERGRNG